MTAFGVAIIGGGGISRAHIAAAKATGGAVRIVAVVDPNKSARRAAADAAEATPFASVEDFLGDALAERAAGVIVCTPPSVRIPIVRTAFGAGKHVLVEKPLAHNVADAENLATLAARHTNLVATVGYCHRFTPAIVEMKHRIAAGDIGDVTRFENTFACPHPTMREHWMSDLTVSGGGSFIDTGCHSIDLFHHLIGPGAVASAVFHHAWPGRGESSATVMLRSDNGVAGVIQSGWLEPARFDVTIVGTKGALHYDYDRATEVALRRNDGRDETISVKTHEVRFQRQLEAFAAAATRESAPRLPATFADGLAVAQIVENAQNLGKSAH